MWATFAQAVAGDALKSGLQSAGGDVESSLVESGRLSTSLGPITAGGKISVSGAGVPAWVLAVVAAAVPLAIFLWKR